VAFFEEIVDFLGFPKFDGFDQECECLELPNFSPCVVFWEWFIGEGGVGSADAVFEIAHVGVGSFFDAGGVFWAHAPEEPGGSVEQEVKEGVVFSDGVVVGAVVVAVLDEFPVFVIDGFASIVVLVYAIF